MCLSAGDTAPRSQPDRVKHPEPHQNQRVCPLVEGESVVYAAIARCAAAR